MVLVFAMMVVGGWGTFSGPILGAFMLVWASELLHEAHQFRLLILGSVIMLAAVALPDGLAPLIGDRLRYCGQAIGRLRAPGGRIAAGK